VAGYNAEQCFKTSLVSMGRHFKVAGLSDCIGSAYQYQQQRQKVIERIQRDGYSMHRSHDVAAALQVK
jgi:hypothetical protein